MSETLKIKVGARIGMARASLTLATLAVTKNRLDLNAGWIGACSFLRDDIVVLKPYYDNALLGNSIQIIHTVPNYKKEIYVTTLEDPKSIINQIKETGFFDNDSIDNYDIAEVRKAQAAGNKPWWKIW